MICPRYYPNIYGGGEVSLKLLAEELAKSQEVNVFSFDGKGRETINGVTVQRFRDLVRLREIKNIYAFLRMLPEVEPFEVLHSFNMKYHPATGLLGTQCGIRTVGTLNDYTFFPPEVVGFPAKHWAKRPYFLVSNRLLLPLVNRIEHFVCISPSVRAIYARNGFDRWKLSVIPQMLDPRFGQVKPQDHESFRVLYVGRVEPEKGVEDLLRAIVRTPADLWIVGDGSSKAALQALVNRSNLSNEIIFWEHVPYSELPTFYAQCSLFVHPARGQEPLGRTVLEALQAGLVVIASNKGGPANILPSPLLYKNGWENLAEKINQVMKTPDTYSTLLEPTRAYVQQHYAPEVIAKQYMEVYTN